jgi:predicted metal-dependent peptidase
MSASDKIKKAKVELILNHPFWGVISSHLKIIEDPSIPTACTNGKYIRYNPNFIDSLTENEVIGILAHEILHVIFLHMLRRQQRDGLKWNLAADYAINIILEENGFSLPEGILFDLQYKDMSAEKIYEIVPDSDMNKFQNIGGVEDYISGDEDSESAKEFESEIKDMIREAKTVSKLQGKELSPTLDRFTDTITKSNVNWAAAINTFVSDQVREDYSWSRCNTRYSHTGFSLPTLYSKKMKPLLIGIDTSGSIDNEMLGVFAGHILAIQAQHNVDIQVVYIDNAINKVEYFESNEDIHFSAVGGGGTDFTPLFDWYKEQETEFSCILYITDLEGIFPNEAPEIPMLWVTKNETITVPFGTKILFD